MPRRWTEFLCDSYIDASPSSSNSYAPRPTHSRRGESPCSISRCLSDSRWSACSSRTSACANGCESCASVINGSSASIHTGFIHRGRLPSVEFLWRSGPVSGRYETVPSLFAARHRARRAPPWLSPAAARNGRSGDVGLPAARRGAGRDRPGPGHPSGGRARGHVDSSRVRHRITRPCSFAIEPLQSGSALTVSIRKIPMLRFHDDLTFAKGSDQLLMSS